MRRLFPVLIVLLTAAGLQAQPALAQTPPTGASPLSTCVWSRISEVDKAEMAAGYHKAAVGGITANLPGFTASLKAKDAIFRSAFDLCHPANVPSLLREVLIATEVVRAGAAAEVTMSRGITQPQLEAAWGNAPKAARDCVYANAITTFGLAKGPCADDKAPLVFLQALNLDIRRPADQPDAFEVLIYMDATAQGLIASGLIDRYDHDPAAQSDHKPQ